LLRDGTRLIQLEEFFRSGESVAVGIDEPCAGEKKRDESREQHQKDERVENFAASGNAAQWRP
jgi:hypothetical protein